MPTTDATTSTLTISVPTTTKDALEALSQATGRNTSAHLLEAIEQYVTVQSQHIAQIQEGIADLDAGRSYPHAEVVADTRRIIDEARRARVLDGHRVVTSCA